jgi:very-short-patch-repair endonuclease
MPYLNLRLLSEWNYLRNIDLETDSSIPFDKKVWWTCSQKHEWEAPVGRRLRDKVGCPYCSSKLVLAGFNDLGTTRPELVQEWHPTKNKDLAPTNIRPGYNKPVWWQDKHGHEWKTSPNTRTQNNTGCPVCAGRVVLAGFNDLNTTHPELAVQWHPTKNTEYLVSEVTAWKNVKVWWLGKCGHEWKATIASRTNGNNCGVCSNQILLVGYNDFATTDPILSTEWHPTKNVKKVDEVFRGSAYKATWLGSCGHEWEAVVGERTRKGRDSNCPRCVRDTSKPERELANELRKLIPGLDCSVNLPVAWGKSTYASVDVFIQELNTIIEYDGRFWHKERIQHDFLKTKALLAAGYNVVRVRQYPLPCLDIADKAYCELIYNKESMLEMASQIMGWIKQ